MSPRPMVRSQRTGLWLGVVGCVAGAWFLYDAHERRGKSRPFVLRFIPGG